MHDALAADLSVSFQNLAKDEDCLFFGHAIGGAFEVLSECAAF